MAFSSKTDYGLVALMELAGIFTSGGVMQVAEIAARQGIPDRYLEQMLSTLRRGGILRSIRGPKGGYQLTRPPADLSIAEVVNCLEGDAPAQASPSRSSAEFEVLQQLDQQLEEAKQRLLQGTSLQDLIDRRDAQTLAQSMYFI